MGKSHNLCDNGIIVNTRRRPKLVALPVLGLSARLQMEDVPMNVDAILRAKGAGVETARPDWTVLQAVQKLAELRVGALVVS
ncbi:MAG: hypothetical protein ACI8S3_002317, partial [Alphaproteobacteria bacterium]